MRDYDIGSAASMDGVLIGLYTHMVLGLCWTNGISSAPSPGCLLHDKLFSDIVVSQIFLNKA